MEPQSQTVYTSSFSVFHQTCIPVEANGGGEHTSAWTRGLDVTKSQVCRACTPVIRAWEVERLRTQLTYRRIL
jgi:hypothetical protein